MILEFDLPPIQFADETNGNCAAHIDGSELITP